MTDPINPALTPFLRECADKGKLIEHGWITTRLCALPPDTSEKDAEKFRLMFYAGARYLFFGTVTVTDPFGDMATGLARMKNIKEELTAKSAMFTKRYDPWEGDA